MIRVLHIIYSGGVGGIERLVSGLLSVQRENNELYASLFVAKPEGSLLGELQAAGAEFFTGNLKGGLDFSPAKFVRMLRIFRRHDVLHFHGFNPFIALAAVLSGKRIIYTEHGNFGFGRKRRASDYVKTILLRLFLNRFVDFITFNSDFTRRISEKKYGIRNVGRSVVYNGIRLDEQNSGSLGLDERILDAIEGRFVVGTASRFAGFKRIDRLIEAFAKFQKGKDAILLLVGDGILRPELESLADSLGIAEKAFFAGFRCNVKDFQHIMNVCVYPSQDEPFGLVAVEALALGKPVIVFEDGGGLVEIIGKEYPKDVVQGVDQLAKRLAYYYDHRLRIQDEAGSRMKYAALFDIKAMAESFLEIYRKFLECAG